MSSFAMCKESSACHTFAQSVPSPGEQAGEKLPFYARWGVSEYLEIDLARSTVRLLRHDDGEWNVIDRSAVIEMTVDEVVAMLHQQ